MKNFQIPVPASYYKVILFHNPQAGEAKVIGFIVPNSDVQNTEISGMAVPIDMVESQTLLDFFSFLPDELENTLESNISDFPFWNELECPDRDCEGIYSGSRKTPEERSELRCE